MKNSIIILLYLFSIVSICKSQVPQDYPFKVILDDSGFVFITGEEESDIFIKKFTHDGNILWNKKYYNIGLDQGMDLSLSGGAVYVTGYISNPISGKFDIIVLKHNRYGSGELLWTKTFGEANYDDQAFAITNDELGYVYITGYSTHKYHKKNMKTLKCEIGNGSLEEELTFDGSLHGDDVGTDILIDDFHLYVLGSTYQGMYYNDDIIQLSYRLNNFSQVDTLIIGRKGKETPTSFIISDFSENILQKSKTSYSVVSSKTFLALLHPTYSHTLQSKLISKEFLLMCIY